MTLQRAAAPDTATRVLAMIRPQLLTVAADVAERVRQSLRYALPRPATVKTFNTATAIAFVTVDDTDAETDEPIEAQVITAYPLRAGDRVFVLFVPPHGLLVVGHALGVPLIANEDDAGFSSALAVAPSWTTIKTLELGSEPLGRAYRLVARTDFGLYSFAAGALTATVEVGVSVDGGTTYVTNERTTSAPASLLYGGGSVSRSAAGSSNVYRPRIRVRAQLIATAGGAYDIRDFFTTWTITPQE